MLHSLLVFVALLAATKVAPEPYSPPDEKFVGPNLPSFTKVLSDTDYMYWVMEQNEIAYDVAAQRANPDPLMVETTVVGQSSGRFRGYNNLRTRQFQTIAPGAAQFGGGPVWIHNPFVR